MPSFPQCRFGYQGEHIHEALDLAKSYCYGSTAARELDLSREMLETCCDSHIKPISLLNCTIWEGNSGHLCKTNLVLNKAVSMGCINQTCSAKHPSVTSGKYGFPVWEKVSLLGNLEEKLAEYYKNHGLTWRQKDSFKGQALRMEQ